MPKLSKKASKKAKRARVHEELHKFKHRQLHSGSKKGPIVKNRKQAIAIALSESGQSKKKIGKVRKKRGMQRRTTKRTRKHSYKRG